MENRGRNRSLRGITWYMPAIFIAAVGLNFAWEIGQAFLYIGMDYDAAMVVHCMMASFGDGFILWVIYLVGVFTFRDSRWFVLPLAPHYAVMLFAGLIISIIVEWIGLDLLNRWAYTASMPVIPVLNIGLIPVLQMLILPPIIFAIVAKLERSSRREPDES
jgi:hypothetical protein